MALSREFVSSFWKHSEYAEKKYVGALVTELTLVRVEKALGFKLPAAYLELMSFQNGGIPTNANHRTTERTCWAPDHIAINGLYSIGGDKPCSLLGEFGSQFWIDDWGYPPIGVYFADCPSAGHDMVCFDYRACGPRGEPQVVHIDQEFDYKITFVAPNFDSFIHGLESDEAFQLGA